MNSKHPVFTGPSGRLKEHAHRLSAARFEKQIAEVLGSHDSPMLPVDPPEGLFPQPDERMVFHPVLSNRINLIVIKDLNRLNCGDPGPFQSPHVIEWLHEHGYDPDTVMNLSGTKRHKIASKMLRHLKALSAEHDRLIEKRDSIKELRDEVLPEDMDFVSKRLQLPFKLERPQGSSLHYLSAYLRELGEPKAVAAADEIDNGVWQSFVVEHDWAAAFQGAAEVDQGEFPLPYDDTCFEFRVNGIRMLMMLRGPQDGLAITGSMFVGVNGRWYLNVDHFMFKDGKVMSDKLGDYVIERWAGRAEEFLNKLGDQIRAICIMLDAQVAERELIRSSGRLNEHRIRKGKPPLRDYHVVSLAGRHRAKPMEDHVPVPGPKKRLHFRRGHWRHYGDHRTWINWMLVGDPDLGFVDKHYKL